MTVQRPVQRLIKEMQEKAGTASCSCPTSVVIAGEIVSRLDVSSQAQILALPRGLRVDMDIALIFISHDVSVIRTICRVMVMLDGQAVESGSCAQNFAEPRHACTRKLLDAIPSPDVDRDWLRAASTMETGENLRMNIKGSTALVTGANRGIGEAFVAELLKRGVKKLYVAARDPSGFAASDTLVPVKLDVTIPGEVEAAARQCSDVTVLINNAGCNFNSPLFADDAMANARTEIEVNYLGTLSVIRAFAPILKANGGGCIVNMLSIIGRVNLPALGSYSASKAAEYSMTQGVRAQLAGQGTLVVGVMPGSVDTRMTPGGETKPPEVATAALDAVEAGTEDVYPGDMALGVSQGLAADAKAVEKELANYLPE